MSKLLAAYRCACGEEITFWPDVFASGGNACIEVMHKGICVTRVGLNMSIPSEIFAAYLLKDIEWKFRNYNPPPGDLFEFCALQWGRV